MATPTPHSPPPVSTSATTSADNAKSAPSPVASASKTDAPKSPVTGVTPATATATATATASATAIPEPEKPKPEPSSSTSAPPPAPAPEPASASDSASSAPPTDSTSDANDADDEASTEPLPDDPEGIINMEIFSQIQDMDDDDDDDAGGHEFSKGIVWGYFEQAENTFKQMEEAIAEPSLWKLSSLGHFLKGSSAALGIVKVQNSCEKMQHYGNQRDEEVGAALSEEEALKRIKQLLVDCKRDYGVASRWLRRLYGDEE